ncbi:clarin-2 [Tupaia chinensis]|uniref:Clarin-2 n=1 Tax=Tupaia chinensis TaxID=246437 RepID=L9J915_TUPCH|nr:clarin-2 [Tupaia chinensis]ELW46981.1 Clarin-2 [Tupaia chinensis]
MPGWFRKASFGLASLLSAGAFVLLLAALAAPRWLHGKILCQTGAELVNATGPELATFIGDISYGLFRGSKVRQCGLGGRQSQFTVFPHLLRELDAGLHLATLLLLVLASALALVSLGFAVLNTAQVPARAMHGPGGVCLWNVLAGGAVALGIASFMAAVKFHDLTERIANFQEKLFRFVVVEEQYEESFWICVASAVALATNLLVVALSQVPLPEIKTKVEEATVTAEDILY